MSKPGSDPRTMTRRQALTWAKRPADIFERSRRLLIVENIVFSMPQARAAIARAKGEA